MHELPAGDGSAAAHGGLKRRLSEDPSPSAEDDRISKLRVLCQPPPMQRDTRPRGGAEGNSAGGVRLMVRAPKPQSADLSSTSSSSCSPSVRAPAGGGSAALSQPDDANDSDENNDSSLRQGSKEPCTPRASSCGSSIFTPEKQEQQQQVRAWSASAASRSLFLAHMNSPKAVPSSCGLQAGSAAARSGTPTSRKDSSRWMSPPTSIIHRLQTMSPPQLRAGTSSPSSHCPATPSKSHGHGTNLGALDPVAALQQWLQLQVTCSDPSVRKQAGQLPAACHEAARQASMHHML